MKVLAFALLLFSLPLLSQTTPASPPDPLNALGFLEGSWEAQTQGGNAGANATGTYTFKRDLGNHILARISDSSACKGPATFNCEHRDLLYVYSDAPGQPLKAIYFDNEGHVIHYEVTTPAPATAVFLSEPSASTPQFRLVYDLKDGKLTGKFQMRGPGQTEWKSYLEWNGPRVTR
jgi:hypothetical protein